MERDVFMKALRATARVACASTLVACQHQPPNAAAPQGADTQDTTAADSASFAASDGLPPAVEACMEQVRDDFGRNKATKDCCQTIAEYYDANSMESMEAWDTRYECCDLLDWPGGMACTPWGPPRPPSARSFSRKATIAKVAAIRKAALA